MISLGGEEKEVTWSGFVGAASKLIIKHYQSGSVEKYKQTWRKRFKETSKELGLKIKRDSSELNIWKDIVVINLKPVSDSSGTSYASTSPLNYQKQLTDDDKVLLKHVHEKIHEKWKLADGIIVEDVIYEEAKEYTVEHPLHSYIIHLNNLNVEELFGKNMLKEMEECSGKRDLMTPLPHSLGQMLLNLNGKGDVDSMDDAFQKLTCNRRTEPDAYWCRESVINYLSLFMNQEDVIPFATEQDLLDDMYGFIKKTKNISSTTTETNCGSSASGYNKNMKRLLGALQNQTK